MLNIHKIVERLYKHYHTRNPFEIAKSKNILIIKEELGTIKGYYNKPYRQKQIHLNCNLDEKEILFTCSHELGHAILHPNSNTPFLKSNTFLSIDKMEIEANKFALELLLSDNQLKEYHDCTIQQLSIIFGYNEKLIELRMQS